MEALLDGEAEAITRVAVEKAKEGDATALRLAWRAFSRRAKIGLSRSHCLNSER